MVDIEKCRLTVGRHELFYLKAGRGPALVLIHGAVSDSRDWLPIISALAASYTIYAPDVAGYGQSRKDSRGYYFSELVESVVGFMDKLGLESA